MRSGSEGRGYNISCSLLMLQVGHSGLYEVQGTVHLLSQGLWHTPLLQPGSELCQSPLCHLQLLLVLLQDVSVPLRGRGEGRERERN